MSAWIISIGDELLTGRVLNWNAYWIAKRLSSMGISVKKIICIPDDKNEIISTIRASISNNINYVFTTGGLGPTPGDITLECIAIALNRNLVLNEKALNFVKKRYLELFSNGLVEKADLDDSRIKMAYTPENSEVIYNDVGVAPAVIIREKETYIFALPGVPSEAMYLFEKIIPYLKKTAKLITIEDYVEVSDESVVSSAIRKVRDVFSDVSVKTYPLGFGQKTMRVIAIGKNKKRVIMAMEMLKNEIKNIMESLQK